MSYRAQDWAEHVTGLPWAAKGVLLLLANRHNGETDQCNPSEDWLCKRTELSGRAIRMHLKVLEDAKLIQRLYKHGGRAVGRSVAGFQLNMGITAAVNEPQNDVEIEQDIATAGYCHGKNTSLPRQDIAKPYKEEPERTGKDMSEIRFEDAWALYKSSPLKAGQTKKLAKAAWPKAVERAGSPERILTAIRADVDARTNPEGFIAPLPDMHRWLKNERWEDAERETRPEPVAELPVESWREAMRKFVDHGTWPAFLGPKPGEEACRVPDGLLNHWKRIAA